MVNMSSRQGCGVGDVISSIGTAGTGLGCEHRSAIYNLGGGGDLRLVDAESCVRGAWRSTIKVRDLPRQVGGVRGWLATVGIAMIR
jgi:hypothetical protein